MKAAVLVFFLAHFNEVNGFEIPEFSSLGARSLEVRERAMEAVGGWVVGNQAEAREILLAKYLRCSDPEVRVRLLLLLERAYFPVEGFVGITMRSTRWDQLGRFQKGNTALGVRVIGVAKGTPAKECGLMVDDLILKINDWTVEGDADVTSEVATQIQKNPPTTPILLVVKRGEKTFDVTLKLAILPIPSLRARLLRAEAGGLSNLLPRELELEILSFQTWLKKEIEEDRKNLIADRRL